MTSTANWELESIDKYSGDYDPGLYEAHGTARAVPGPLDALTPADWSQYRSEGYVAIRDVLNAETVASANAGIDALISGSSPEFRGIQWEGGVRGRLPHMSLDERRASVRKLVYYVDHDRRLHDIAFRQDILRFVAEVLGGEPELFADQALLKPAGGGREKPWHQDNAYFDIRPGAPVVGLWIALDDTDVENGCMHVIPGSHRSGPLAHFNRRDFQICDTDVRRDAVIAVPLAAGGCLVFDGLLHHGTPTNRSARRRWALQLHYAPADAIWRTKQERAEYRARRLDTFGADGKGVTC